MTDRFVVMGVTHLRSPWFDEVARWATGGTIAIDFVKCVGVAEVAQRLRGGAACSAVLIDAAAPGLDRDLLTAIRRSGAALICVTDPRVQRPAPTLPHITLLPPTFGPEELITTLAAVAQPVSWRTVDRAAEIVPGPVTPEAGTRRAVGRVVAVCGRGGAGSSVISMALAQQLSLRPDGAGSVGLADLTLNGDLACYHDAVDVIPGVQEFVEAHRHGSPGRSNSASMLHEVPERGYALLLGLRRRHDWTVIQPAATAAALDSLAGWFRWTVCDITADFETEEQTGSVDVEERHSLALGATGRADVVVAVGVPTMKGVRDLVRLIDDLVATGVDPASIQPAVNHSPRSRNARAEIAGALGTLCVHPPKASPVYVWTRRGLDTGLRCADRLPSAVGDPVADAVTELANRHLSHEPVHAA